MTSKRFTWTEIQSNNTRTIFLFIAFFLLIAAISTGIGYVMNNVILGWVIGALFFLGYGFFAYTQGSNVALSMNGATPADKTKYRQLHNVVEEIAIAASIPKPDVYIIDDNAPNAFATGMKPEKSAVAITKGLLNDLDRDELTGVIAHEVAHINNRDTKTMLIAGVLVGSIVILSDIFFRLSIFNGGDERGGHWLFLLLGLLSMILAPFIAEIIRLAVSRKREYAADAKAVELTRNPDGLAGALQKLKDSTDKMKQGSRSLNHLYIRSELSDTGFFNKLFSTHPPLEDRIKRIRDL